MITLKRLMTLLVPILFGSVAFPIHVLIYNLFPHSANFLLIFGLEALIYFGGGVFYLFDLIRKREFTDTLYLIAGLIFGSIFYYFVMALMFGLACANGGGCM